MYWQVYLHKTVLAAEKMLEMILQRAKDLVSKNIEVRASGALEWFFRGIKDASSSEILENFSLLDDSDIMASIKEWRFHPDKILSFLSDCLTNRRLFRIEIQTENFEPARLELLRNTIKEQFYLKDNEIDYYLYYGQVSNMTYSNENETIPIMRHDKLFDISKASDMLSPAALSHDVIKYYLCYPKQTENL